MKESVFKMFDVFIHFCTAFAHCFILRVCHEWGQNKRWGAARHVKRSGISIRIYSILKNIVNIYKIVQQCRTCFPTNRFSDMLAFHVCCRVKKTICPKSVPEVSGGCLGPPPTNYGQFWTHSDQKSPNQQYYKKSYKQFCS